MYNPEKRQLHSLSIVDFRYFQCSRLFLGFVYVYETSWNRIWSKVQQVDTLVDTKTTYVLVFSRHNLLSLYEATFDPTFQEICSVITSHGNLTSLNIKIGLLC